MPREIDEDLIEQTIRRVAEAKARAAAGPDDAAEGEPADNEDLIEKTIRRVAQAKAHRELAAADDAEAEDEAPPVTPAGPDQADAVEHVRPLPPPPAGHPPATAWDDEEDYDDPPAAAAASAPIAAGPGLPHSAPLADAGHLEARLEAAVRSLEGVARRLEDILPMLSRVAQGGGAPAPTGAEDDEQPGQYDGLLRLPITPPRPPIFRDPSPRTATAEQPEPEFIDARPIPKPLPPLQPQPEPRRGLDLLPRTYRVTVEDKRRGVDLVPLHRALLSMEGVRDMSLLSYNNGIAIVSLDTTTDIDPDTLAASVSRAMSRPARAEQHNEHTLVVKLAED